MGVRSQLPNTGEEWPGDLGRGCDPKEITWRPRWALSCGLSAGPVCSRGHDNSWPRPCQGAHEQVGRATVGSPSGQKREAISMLSDRY